jgi:hypothetical protein
MAETLEFEKYSLGVGDRFAHQAQAQLRACMMAPEAAVKALGWQKPYHGDADHM